MRMRNYFWCQNASAWQSTFPSQLVIAEWFPVKNQSAYGASRSYIMSMTFTYVSCVRSIEISPMMHVTLSSHKHCNFWPLAEVEKDNKKDSKLWKNSKSSIRYIMRSKSETKDKIGPLKDNEWNLLTSHEDMSELLNSFFLHRCLHRNQKWWMRVLMAMLGMMVNSFRDINEWWEWYIDHWGHGDLSG